MLYPKEKLETLRHRWTTEHGKKLIKAIKQSHCYLSPVLFRDKVHNLPGLTDDEVKDGIDLRGAPLSGFDFRVEVKEDDNGFCEDMAIISDVHFEGATLRHCSFEDGKIQNCNFEDCDLTHAEFKLSTLNTCSFENANLNSVDFSNTKIINCRFENADLKDISLTESIIDQKTNFGKKLKSEKEKNYHFASIEYKQIKTAYKNSSLHNLADHFLYKEMVCKRRLTHPLNPMRWLNFIFGDLLCKYGTSFVRIFIASLVVMAICAAIFNINGSLISVIDNEPHGFLNSLYFSLVTFTTLGYGDYHVVGYLRFLAGFESFIGACLMSLFTVVVARKIIRD